MSGQTAVTTQTLERIAVIVTVVLPIWYGVYFMGGLVERTDQSLAEILEVKTNLKEVYGTMQEHEYRIRTLEFRAEITGLVDKEYEGNAHVATGSVPPS